MGRKRKKQAPKRVPNLKDEEWALIKDTEDYYISNKGRFKRITSKGESLRSISVDAEGYCRVNIGKKRVRLHRLVAEAFVPNPNDYPVVDHLDANKKNCSADNLEWVTQGENVRRAANMGLITNGISMLVLAIDQDLNCYLYNNLAECASALDIPERSVGKVASGKQKTAHGYNIIKVKEFEDRRR